MIPTSDEDARPVKGPVLVTGATGFVGRHVEDELDGRAVAVDVDVTDARAVRSAVRDLTPSAVVHLAARSSVATSWTGADELWNVNVVGTVNVLEAVRAERHGARVLVASSGEVYGAAELLPTPEDAATAPLSPYAASKLAAEVACDHARRVEGVDVVVARSFAAAGPGQDERFAIGSWAHQIARLELEGGGPLRVGDLSVKRDIVDVRDVARAYRLLIEPSVPATTYNIASGRPVGLRRVVDVLVEIARCRVDIERDPARLRAAEASVTSGDSSRLTAATGWQPQIPLEQTLADALESARDAVRGERITTS